MKKFLVKVFIFAVLFIIIDRAIGYGFSRIMANAIDGETLRHTEIADKTTANVITMGSSRCEHHYDPRIISNVLHTTCYNAGQGGHGILMMYAYYKMLSSRYQPKLIIFDVSLYDVNHEDYSRDLEFLRQYYDRPTVDSIAIDIDPNERYKMLCQAYHYNGKALTIIVDAIQHKQPNINGYRPIVGYIKDTDVKRTNSNNKSFKIDSFKKKYIIRLVRDCQRQGTKLVFCVSPTYLPNYLSEYYSEIISLCQQYNVPLLYHGNDSSFTFHSKYFSDRVHMNENGASKYTKKIAYEIKSKKYY